MPYRCCFLLVSLLLLGLCASPASLSAQEVTFTHLTIDDGLPSNGIEEILQDLFDAIGGKAVVDR